MAFSTKEETRAYAKGRADERKLVQVGTSWAQMSGPGPTGALVRKSDQRFMIERASHFRSDQLDKDIWHCIMDAKRAYKQIEAIGRTIYDDAIS